MATATAGFQGKVEVDSTEITGAYNVDLNRTMEEILSTTFGDSDQRRVYGLGDVEFSIECIWSATDAGQEALWTAMQTRQTVEITYLVDGTNGFEAECIVTNASVSSEVDGRGEVTFDLALATGTLTRI